MKSKVKLIIIFLLITCLFFLFLKINPYSILSFKKHLSPLANFPYYPEYALTSNASLDATLIIDLDSCNNNCFEIVNEEFYQLLYYFERGKLNIYVYVLNLFSENDCNSTITIGERKFKVVCEKEKVKKIKEYLYLNDIYYGPILIIDNHISKETVVGGKVGKEKIDNIINYKLYELGNEG